MAGSRRHEKPLPVVAPATDIAGPSTPKGTYPGEPFDSVAQANCLGQSRRPPGRDSSVRRCPRGLVRASLASQARQAFVMPCSRSTGDVVVTGHLAQDFFED